MTLPDQKTDPLGGLKNDPPQIQQPESQSQEQQYTQKPIMKVHQQIQTPTGTLV